MAAGGSLKHKADGSIERARIVAKGFTQTYSIDYLETFALVAKLNSIPYESFCQLQLTDLGHCISSMSKGPFFMETSTRFSSSGGFQRSNADHSVFIKRRKEETTVLLVYSV